MPVIRPEIRAMLSRWSEVLAGLCIAVFGLWALHSHNRFFQLIALLVVLIGLGLAVIGWRRLRFRRDGTDAGVVQVVEGQISYFGPETGGFISLSDMVELHLIKAATQWLLIAEDGTRLEIPVAATGSDALFDAFSSLPEVRMHLIIAKLNADQPVASQTVWIHPARRADWLQLR